MTSSPDDLAPRWRRAAAAALRPDTLAWLAPLLLFATVRLFSGSEHLPVGGDQCKYLVLGRTFPLHRLDGDALFLLHPPAFGYSIGLLALVLPLLAAGLAATIAWAVAGFFAIRALGRLLGLAPTGLMVGLLFLALDRPSAAYDSHVSRVPIMVCTFALALLAYERWRLRPGRASAAWVLVSSALAHLATDQALILLACQVIVFGFHFDRRRVLSALALLAGTAVTFLAWPAVRLWVFAHHAHYPAGLDGTIELTQPIRWQSLIQTHYLAFTRAHAALYMKVDPSLADFAPSVVLQRPASLLLVPPVVAGGVVAPLVIAAFLSRERRRLAAKLATLSVALLLPATIGLSEWHGMGFVVPFAVLLGLGATTLWERLPRAGRWAPAGGATLCVALAVSWLLADAPQPLDLFRPSPGSHLLFRREPVTRAAGLSSRLRELPDAEAIMAPVGLTPELVYLTGRRVVALPFEPPLIEPFAREYGVRWIVLSDEFLRRYLDDVEDKWSGALATRYVIEHPERFEPVGAMGEAYPAFYPSGTFMLFRLRD